MTADNDAPRDLVDGRIRPISMEAMIKRVKARVNHGNINIDQKALVFEGEAGCGKTSILLQTLEEEMGLKPFKVCLGAQQVEELLAAGIKVGEDKDGDAGNPTGFRCSPSAFLVCRCVPSAIGIAPCIPGDV